MKNNILPDKEQRLAHIFYQLGKLKGNLENYQPKRNFDYHDYKHCKNETEFLEFIKSKNLSLKDLINDLLDQEFMIMEMTRTLWDLDSTIPGLFDDLNEGDDDKQA